jgi:hypothetical protein
MIITWLAAVIRGDYPEWPFEESFDHRLIQEAAHCEGVLALLYDRLLEARMAERVPHGLIRELSGPTRSKVAQSLFRESHCRVLLKHLSQAGISTLLLKGSALAYWAYSPPHLRECGDIDLLLSSRADVDRAVEILEELEFELRERALPGDLVCYEVTCVGTGSQNEGLEIDLHWQISSTPVFAFRFTWSELYSGAIELPKLAANARGISAIPALLHACMHRVQNMANGPFEKLKWLYDLSVLGERFSPGDWEALTHQAIQRGLAGTCADGIRAASERFGEIAPEGTRKKLEAAARLERLDVKRMHRWWYIQRMSLLAFPSTGQRLSWLRQRLIPDLAYTRDRYGEGRGFWRSFVLRLGDGARRLRN